jgi:hypothetical protein
MISWKDLPPATAEGIREAVLMGRFSLISEFLNSFLDFNPASLAQMARVQCANDQMPEMVKFILGHISQTTNDRATCSLALYLAAAAGDLSQVDDFHFRGGEPGRVWETNWVRKVFPEESIDYQLIETPLTAAIFCRHQEVALFLLSLEVDVDFLRQLKVGGELSPQVRTPLQLAAEGNCPEVLEALLNRGLHPDNLAPQASADSSSRHDLSLFLAHRAGHRDVVLRLLEAGARVSPLDKDMAMTLSWAERFGYQPRSTVPTRTFATLPDGHPCIGQRLPAIRKSADFSWSMEPT